jgi:hypothetical protein
LEFECPRESDVLDALASSRWPHRVDAELSNHVASCAICRDVITVAAAMQADHDDAWREANVPSSGQMWWRAEMRARQDAIRHAARPVTVAQGVAAVFALALAGVAAWFAWPSLHSLFSAIVPGGDAQSTTFASPLFIPIAIAMGAFLVLAPVAIYVVMSEIGRPSGSPACSLQIEILRDRHPHLDGLTVDDSRRELPCAGCIDGRLIEQWNRSQHFRVADPSPFVDDDLEDDDALDACIARLRRILRPVEARRRCDAAPDLVDAFLVRLWNRRRVLRLRRLSRAMQSRHTPRIELRKEPQRLYLLRLAAMRPEQRIFGGFGQPDPFEHARESIDDTEIGRTQRHQIEQRALFTVRLVQVFVVVEPRKEVVRSRLDGSSVRGTGGFAGVFCSVAPQA